MNWSCWWKRVAKEKETLKLGVGPDLTRLNNQVLTARYNVLTFFPLSLLGQFRHFSNVYFLVIFIIALIGDNAVSNLNWYQSPYEYSGFLLSLSVVVAIGMVFDLVYDIFRHREDWRVNGRITTRIIITPHDDANKDSVIEKCTWDQLRPGDFIQVEQDETLPADVLFLSAHPISSAHADEEEEEEEEEDAFATQHCYVETSNIDGETNLKLRLSPAFVAPPTTDTWPEYLKDWTCVYDLPKPALDFSGQLLSPSAAQSSGDVESSSPPTTVPLSFKNILLRGSKLKNTQRITGLVLYAGRETKGVLSSNQTVSKMSNAMVLINRAILIILFVGLIMVIVSAAVSASLSGLSPWYLGNPEPYVFGPFFSSFFTYIILYSNLLPISLVIATTITNFMQAMFVNWDVQMHDGTNSAKCSTLELAQEIGQVSFVFSDKTGTLTRNEMKLVKCYVSREVVESPVERDSSLPIPELFPELLEKLPQSLNIQSFLMSLAICHTVLVDASGRFNAEGPDEEALVFAMSELGYKLVKTTRSYYTIQLPSGILEEVEILAINAFDSYRKRMSSVIRFPATGRVEIICKGADSVMSSLLQRNEDYSELASRLKAFADEGLRTLVVGKRTVSEEELLEFQSRVLLANQRLDEEKAGLLNQAALLLENNLVLLGATGIEDRLQEGVPETLKALRGAGIKTWVLTGDKAETAINIGFSSGLLTPDMMIVKLLGKDKDANDKSMNLLAKSIDPHMHDQLGKRNRIFHLKKKKVVKYVLNEGTTAEDPYEMGKQTKILVANGFAMPTRALKRMFPGSLESSTQDNPPKDAEAQVVVEEEERGNLEDDNPSPPVNFWDPMVALTEVEISNLALVVDGDCLETILYDCKSLNARAVDDKNYPITKDELLFLSIAKVCKVVIACRVSPRQKALLVRVVRKGVRVGNKEPITLAIGDGSNDVGMIQESRVGVGIAGREGSQAVNCADFSIGQFRFLQRLLLVHGRWNYRRISFLVLFIFYAHILPVLVAFAYNFCNMWSGTTPFPFVWTVAYSYIAIIPAIVIASMNRDISAKTALEYPSIYISGRANLHMGRFKIMEYVIKAIAHASILAGLIYGAFALKDLGYLDLGTTVYWSILLTVLVRLAFECYSWTLPTAIVYFICLIIFPILQVFIYDSIEYYEVLFGPFASWVWLVVFFIATTCLVLDLILGIMRRQFFPTLIDRVIAYDRDEDVSNLMKSLLPLLKPKRDQVELDPEEDKQARDIPVIPENRSAFAQDYVERQGAESGPRSAKPMGSMFAMKSWRKKPTSANV